LDELALALGETRSRELKVKPGRDKDMGLDVVAWKHFPDQRRGKVVVFGQCATGENWREKLGEPDLTHWRRYIAWHVQPLRVLAVPWTIESDDWDWIEGHGLLTLDRIRASAALTPWAGPAELTQWCRERLRDPVLKP
jgi:hypothetical protein